MQTALRDRATELLKRRKIAEWGAFYRGQFEWDNAGHYHPAAALLYLLARKRELLEDIPSRLLRELARKRDCSHGIVPCDRISASAKASWLRVGFKFETTVNLAPNAITHAQW